MKKLPAGWKKVPTDSGGAVLFKLFKTTSLADSFEHLERISPQLLNSIQQKHISVSLTSDYLTISLNDLGKGKSLDDFFKIAESINTELDT